MPGEEKSSHSSGDGLPVLQDNQNGDKYWTAERYEMWVAYGYLYNAIANNPSPFGIPSGNADNAINEIIKKVMSPDLTENGVYSFFGLIKNDAGELVDDGSGKGADLGNRISTCEDIMRVRGMVGSIEYDRSKPDRNGLKGFTGHHFNELIGFARKVSKSGQMLSNSEFKDYAEAKSKKELGKYYTKIKDLIEGWDQPLTGESGEDGKLVQELEKEQKELSTLKRSISTSRRESARQVVPTTLSLAGFGGGVAGLLTGGGGILSGLVGIGSLASPFGIFVVGAGLTFGGFTALKHFGGKLISQFSKTGELKRQLRDLKKGKYAQASIELKGAIAAKHFIESKDGKFKSTQEKKDFLRACRECVNFQGIGIDELKSERNKFRKSNNLKTFVDNIQAPAKFMNAYDTTSSASMLNSYPGLIENAKTLEEIRGLYQGLKNNYDSEKDGDTKRALHDIMEKASDKMVNLFNDIIFDNAYTTDTQKIINDASSDKIISQALEEYGIGGNTSNVKDSIEFSRLVKDQNGLISSGLGVSMRNQLIMSEGNLLAGAKQTSGIEPTDEVREFAQKIANNVNTKSEYNSVRSELDASSIDLKTKTYFKFILEKKGKSVVLDESYVATQIDNSKLSTTNDYVSKIASLTNQSDANLLKNEILGLVKPDGVSEENFENEKTRAIEVINNQIEAFESKKIEDLSAKMVDEINGGHFNGFSDLAKQISEFKGFEIESVSTLYQNIDDACKDNKVVGDYLKFQLSNKVVKQIQNVIKTDKYSTSPEAIKNLSEFMVTLSNLTKQKYISEAQSNFITKNYVEANLQVALNKQINSSKRNFAIADGYNSSVFDNILKEDYSNGGFKEFFDLKTESSKKIKDEIDKMIGLDGLHKIIYENINLGGKPLSYANPREAQLFSEIYFSKDRLNTDGLNIILNGMSSSLATNIDSGKFDNVVRNPNVAQYNANDFVNNAKATITAIEGLSDDNEKLAALLILKKYCILAFKQHSQDYAAIKITAGTKTGYFNDVAHQTDYINNVINLWTDGTDGVLKLIDDKLSTLHAASKGVTYACASIKPAGKQATVVSYMDSDGLER